VTTTATIAPINGLKRAFAALCVGLLLAPALASAPAAAREVDRLVSVIVQGITGDRAAAVTEAVGGRDLQLLPIVEGVAARVPQSQLETLRATPGIVNVTRDSKVAFQGNPHVTDSLDPKRIHKVIGTDKLWKQNVKGSGVNIAILDTGIHAAHPDLAGRVVHCEDLSHEADTVAHCQDTFGHGTFMAGLAAGNGASSNGKYSGSAPAAGLVAIKVAGFDGAADVSNVLAGIQWAVSFKDQYDIEVLNLSLGTDSSQDYRLSPLNHAVERAWMAGITVVVSAGNTGPDSHTVMKPGDDPYVITVGASSDMGTMGTSDDKVAGFSGRGPTRSNGLSKPDLVAPGVHTISLRSPGSAIDQQFPGSRVDAGYFRGTGTSMATATVSGVAAQILQKHPNYSPDDVKAALTGNATTIADTGEYLAGSGQVNAYAAATALLPPVGAPPGPALSLSTGLGSIELDRGSVRMNIQTPVGELPLVGEFIAKRSEDFVSAANPGGLVPFTASNWSGSNWSASNWSASNWSGSNWSGSNWSASNWSGSNWSGSNWSASNWSGSNWSGSNWSNADWDASNWSGSNWSGSNWSASNWQSAWYAAAWD
jgi:serine protease AprX